MQFDYSFGIAGTDTHRMVVSASSDLSTPSYGVAANAANGLVKLASPPLAAGNYYVGVEENGVLRSHPRTTARIPADTHRFLFGSCNHTASRGGVWEVMAAENADWITHLGDFGYEDPNSTDVQVYLDNFNLNLTSPELREFFRQSNISYTNDDHEIINDCFASPEVNAFIQAFRQQVPHQPLELSGSTDPIYRTVDVGKVRYIHTDLRTAASDRADTDDSSKTMMGATQKAWFKDVVSNSPGMGLVWCGTRTFHMDPDVGHDGWGGFTTERTELCDYIDTHARDRFCTVYGDRHQGGIDDGTNANYTTAGQGFPIFIASPFARSSISTNLCTYSEGGRYDASSMYGDMAVTDPDDGTLDIDWVLHSSVGASVRNYSFTMDITSNGGFSSGFSSGFNV